MAVRTDRGRLHIARRVGRVYETACHRTVSVRAAGAVYERREADRAWQLERCCPDCQTLARRGVRELVRVAGW